MNNLNKKLCDEWNLNKSVNPITKRTIKVDGPVYNKIKKNCGKNTSDNKTKKKEKETKKSKGSTKDICGLWLNNPSINPETGKSIKKNGPVYKKLLKLCDEKKIKSKTSSSSTVSSKTRKICDEWKNNPTINPETGYKIKIDGPKYNYFKSLCLLNIDKKVKSASQSLSVSTPSFHTAKKISSPSKYHSREKSLNDDFYSVKSSLSSMNNEDLKRIFDKDKKLKQSIFNKLKKLDNIKKSSLKSKSKSSSSSSSITSSIINPYFYHNDDYKPKKSSEEISLEKEIFDEIKSSLSTSSTSSQKSKDSKEKMEQGFLGKLFNIFGF